jgi:hypothetical protein
MRQEKRVSDYGNCPPGGSRNSTSTRTSTPIYRDGVSEIDGPGGGFFQRARRVPDVATLISGEKSVVARKFLFLAPLLRRTLSLVDRNGVSQTRRKEERLADFLVRFACPRWDRVPCQQEMLLTNRGTEYESRTDASWLCLRGNNASVGPGPGPAEKTLMFLLICGRGRRYNRSRYFKCTLLQRRMHVACRPLDARLISLI